MMFKICHGLVEIDHSTCLTPGDKRTRGAMLFLQPTAMREVYNMSFFPRTIRDWNVIPSSVRTAKNIEAFRMQLSAFQSAVDAMVLSFLIVYIVERFLAIFDMRQCIFTLPRKSCT